MKRFFLILSAVMLLQGLMPAGSFAQEVSSSKHSGAYPTFIDHLQWGTNGIQMPSTMTINQGKSSHFSADVCNANIDLDARGVASLSAGLRFVYDDYVFNDKVSVAVTNGVLTPFAIDPSYTRSKLAAYYLGLPVYLNVNVVKNVLISIGGYVDYCLGSYTKYKKPKHKNGIDCINPFQAGLIVELNFWDFGMYFSYALTPLFKNGVGPDMNSLSVGFMLDM